LSPSTVNEQDEKRGHDFGHDIIPSVFQRSRVFAFTLQSPVDGLEPYWKDVGTIEAYFESSLELLNEQSPFRLNDPAWPIRSYKPNLVPAIVLADKKIQQNGYIRNAMLCAGSVVSMPKFRSVLSDMIQELLRVVNSAIRFYWETSE